jgi:hypothetical protein
MSLLDWLLLKTYMMEDELLYLFISLFILGLGSAILITRKAANSRVVRN